MNNPFTLNGKKILVTGASSGIGKAIAIECSKMGASLYITARDEVRLKDTYDKLENGNCNHVQIIADLLNNDDLDTLVKSVSKLDGVVLCAGKGLTLPFQFAKRDKIDNIFNINFFAPVELLRLFYKKKLLNKGASIVLLSSIGGINEFTIGNSMYGASKAAVNSVMKFCAKEFAPKKIRVNSICPGMVDTPLIHKGTISEDQLMEDMKKYPLKRYGKPEDIAYGTIYLLSDASSWVTGHPMIIDGGSSIK